MVRTRTVVLYIVQSVGAARMREWVSPPGVMSDANLRTIFHGEAQVLPPSRTF